jgi:hypothetical protein
MKKLLFLVAGFALLASSPAMTRAGISDAPPLLQGERALALFSVSGVVTAGGLGTYFSCTSASSAPIRVSVEVFDETTGSTINDPSAVSVSVAPGGTVMFATQNESASFCSAQPLTPSPVFLPLGSARILSTSKALVCTAFLADAYNDPPTSMVPLAVVGKTKQKGA